jgi:rifampicin phosphotransferase
MAHTVKSFKGLTPEFRSLAGGKGRVLAQLFQKGYPVPDGLVVLPTAFKNNQLNDNAWIELQACLRAFRQNDARFAVRSSALAEDSARASFAGEFETVLNVSTDEEIREAVLKVHNSRLSERVKVYSAAHGLDHSHRLAVVIQLMVQSEISGVLFTADPISGNFARMVGSYVHGLGEQLVSGEANAHSFTFKRPGGTYEGPEELKPYAAKLYKLARRLETELGGPLDIEWTIAKGRLHLLQARPITTLTAGNLDTYEINDSLAGDYLWTNANIGEAMSDPFTPLSWSIMRMLDKEQERLPGHYMLSGNICGRPYTNISLITSLAPAFGGESKSLQKRMSSLFGELPEGVESPIYPFERWPLVKAMAPRMLHRLKCLASAFRSLGSHIKETPDWCRQITARIEATENREELLSIWTRELWPYNCRALWALLASGGKLVIAFRVHDQLIKLIGKEDTNALLSNLRGDAGLESLGLVIGISKIIKGDMTREEYLLRYGHRGPHEFELSIPDAAEDKEWLDRQIADFKQSNIDVEGLLKKQRTQSEIAWKNFQQRHPKKAKRTGKRLAKVAACTRLREAARSEWTRVLRANRAFALKAGQLTGTRDHIFFFYLNEILDLLAGDDSAMKFIDSRMENYDKYKSLPRLPSNIRGRFDPFTWAMDPNRRVDYYDPAAPLSNIDSETLKGFAGAAGRIEGRVRILSNLDEGEILRPGEILVASTTNVGWTTLFPKASAIITDIGEPLSHAAIVARELGIPAVVGCGNATTRLRTGDKVIVDGGQGVVHVLSY